MENSVIAVQIANGTFVPVLNTSSRKRRRLVVTTVRDNQTDVRIGLFRGSDESMSDPEYVGSLIIENLDPSASGEPDISVLLGIDESENFNATATDTRSGEYQSLSVGLDQIGATRAFDGPDFQLTDEELVAEELSMDEEELDLDELDLYDAPRVDDEADELSDLSFDDLTVDAASTDGPSTDAASTDDELLGYESLDAILSDESDELDDLSLDGLTVDVSETEDELDEADEFEVSEELDEIGRTDDVLPAAASTGADSDDEDFSFDDEMSLDDMSLDELSTPNEEEREALVDFPESDFALDESFSSESELPDEERLEEPDFGLDSDEFSFDEEVDDGLVEADLGDEDFTFDEGMEDESIFADPAAQEIGEEIEDTLSPEEFDRLDSEPGHADLEPEADGPIAPRRSNAIVFVGYLILALAALGVLTYLVYRLMEGPPAPPLRAGSFGQIVTATLFPFVPRRARRREG